MPSLANKLPPESIENVFLLSMLTGQPDTQNVSVEQLGTAYSINADVYFSTVVPVEFFTEIRKNEIVYGQSPYIKEQLLSEEQQKEREWLNLVGEDFYELSPEKRSFLIKTAGIFDFGENINIEKVYKTSIY